MIQESAGGVVLNKRKDVLVVNQNGNSWSLPKGHLEPGEDALTAAKREIREESGLSELVLLKKLGTYERSRISLSGGIDPRQMKRITIFLFTTAETELRPTDPQNPEARWVGRSQVASLLTHPKDKEFFLSVMDQLPQEAKA